jgi:TolB-like protein/Tfp pilus assembly protein PilF
VLPFRSLNADKKDDFMGLGMADTLITRLSNIREIVVRPTSAVRRYSTPDQDPVAAGREQMVEAVLEGTMQLSGNRLWVRAQLVNVSDRKTLWGFQCDAYCNDIFEAQDAISQKVAEALKLKLSGDEKIQLSKRATENLEAYQQYSKGRYFWERRTFESLQKAIGYFEQAIKLDQNYALAYTGLADCYVVLWGRGYYPFSKAGGKIRAAAARALEIDDKMGEAHTDMAAYYGLEYNFRECEREHERAIALSPNYPTAHMWYGHLLEALGRHEAALAQRTRAQELDPLGLTAALSVGGVLGRMGHYEKAAEQYRKTLELSPDFEPAHESLGYFYLQLGKYSEAIEHYERTHARGALGFTYAVAGKRAEAQRILAELMDESKRQYVSAINMALIHIGLGDKDQAFAWLERAYIEHSQMLLFLRQDHAFYSSLESDPRYEDLLRRIGL